MRFCTALNCMDGRTQLPVIFYLQKRFRADYVDTITEPGMNLLLAGLADKWLLQRVLAKVGISVNAHKSVGLAVVGHHDCAGNPADKQTQLEQIRAAVDTLRRLYPDLPVIGLWLGSSFSVEELPA